MASRGAEYGELYYFPPMDPAIEAAVIAGGVGVLTLIGTLAAQFYGIRRTSTDTLNARFATAADKLGSDAPAVRLAGVYAMAGLADDWEENRQTCINVLCAYLRLPHERDPGPNSPAEHLTYQANQQVRRTVIQVIAQHLRSDASVSWQGHDLNFDGVKFDGSDPEGARFSDFERARFSGGTVSFRRARFSSERLSFRDAVFSGARVTFRDAVFGGGRVTFGDAQFGGGTVNFADATFSSGIVNFKGATFSGGNVNFGGAKFSGAEVNFGGGQAGFTGAKFPGGEVGFGGAEFSGGKVGFGGAEFSGGKVNFTRTWSSLTGAVLRDAEFSGGEVDFSHAKDWSFPPVFPWAGMPPRGVKLPKKEDQSPA